MALAVGVHGLLFVFIALRWSLVVRACGLPLRPGTSWLLTLTSHFFSTCLPGNGAGDLVKGWLFSRRGIDFGTVFGTMVIDRMIGMCGMFTTWALFLTAGILLHPTLAGLLWPFLVLAIAAALGFLGVVSFSGRLLPLLDRLPAPAGTRRGRLVERVRTALAPLAAGAIRPRLIAAGMGLSLANQSCQIATAWLAGQILSIPASLVACGAVIPLVSLANSLPVSPGGVGVGETAGALALRAFGLPPDAGSQIVLATRVASVFWALAGGICYLALRTPARRGSTAEG